MDPRAHPPQVLTVCGLAFEAAIAAGPGVVPVCAPGPAVAACLDALLGGADDAGSLDDAGDLEATDDPYVGDAGDDTGDVGDARAAWSGILSFGCAGGLDPGLLPGDCVVAGAVWTPAGLLPTDPAWTQALLACLPRARLATVAGVDAPLASSAAKAALYRASGAGAVDMESHAAARVARRHGLPFAACRIVLDPAWRALPACALSALRADGRTAPWPLVRRLAADPRQLMALCALGDDAWLARRVLREVRRRLGRTLALPGRACLMPRL